MTTTSFALPAGPVDSSLAVEKRCPKCGAVKPLDRFSKDKSTSTGLPVWCRACDNKKARSAAGPRKATLARIVRNRARQKATAALVAAHQAEFRALLEARQLEALAEAADLIADEAAQQNFPIGQPVRLRPGKRVDDNGEPVGPRINTTWCPDCREYHDRGHHELVRGPLTDDQFLEDVADLAGDNPDVHDVARRMGLSVGEIRNRLHRLDSDDLLPAAHR